MDFYISFYRWTVAWRQQRNATAHGATMLEWAPRNLQSSILLAPLDTTWAEYTGVRTPEGVQKRAKFHQFDADGIRPKHGFGLNGPLLGHARTAELRRV